MDQHLLPWAHPGQSSPSKLLHSSGGRALEWVTSLSVPNGQDAFVDTSGFMTIYHGAHKLTISKIWVESGTGEVVTRRPSSDEQVELRISLVVHWISIHLPMQQRGGSTPGLGRSLMLWSNEASAPQLLRLCSRAHQPHLLSPWSAIRGAPTVRSLSTTTKNQCNQKINEQK